MDGREPGDREYAIALSWKAVILAIVFFGACTAFYVRLALTDRRGLILNHVIEFSPEGARQFWWILAVLSLGLTLAGVAGGIMRLRGGQRLILGRDTISLPQGRWSGKSVTIPYETLVSVTLTVSTLQRRTYRFLTIRYPGGKYAIAERMLPVKTDFDDVCGFLGAKVQRKSPEGESR